HGGNIWAAMRQSGLPPDRMIDFSVDLNPLGPPPCVRTLIGRHLEDLQRYPDPDAQPLREAIAAFHDIAPDTILPGNGAAELIWLVARLRPIAKAVIVVPTFSEYGWAVEHSGASVVEEVVADEDRRFELDMSAQAWDEKLAGADVVFLCNPNNPTGAVVRRDEVLRLAQWCRQHGALFVVDECFVDFAEHPEQVSILPDALREDHVVVLRSLTKSFAVPGLRLGYLAAHEHLVRALRALQPPWPLNTFALAVGEQLVKETAYLQQSRRMTARWREEFRRLLQTVPSLTVFPSHTNFLLCGLQTAQRTSADLARRLAAQGLLIRTCDDFHGLAPGRFIRLAVRIPEDNARLVHALREVMTDAG
ncbi:MAG: threonine-phosphate decarboxylase, partial [Candidatus Omnitrophica bacterium]|nr:threonine-phosphate decarboxylase [Candidatus Omnitrophota bacterium]